MFADICVCIKVYIISLILIQKKRAAKKKYNIYKLLMNLYVNL